MEEAMKIISQIVDDVSVDITEANFDELVVGSENPWFVYFYYPESVKCRFYGPQWKFFAQDVKEQELKLNIGKVNMEKNMRLCVRLKISNFPSFYYFTNGLYYNYTGPYEDSDLPPVHNDKLYLQYDNKPIPAKLEKEFSLVKEFNKYYKLATTQYLYYTIGAAAFVIFSVVVMIAYKSVGKKKTKSD